MEEVRVDRSSDRGSTPLSSMEKEVLYALPFLNNIVQYWQDQHEQTKTKNNSAGE